MEAIVPAPENVPPYKDAMRQGDWDRAVVLLEERAANGDLAPDEALALARVLSARGDNARARAMLEPLEAHARDDIACEALLQDAALVLGVVPPDFPRAEELHVTAARRAGTDIRLRGLVAHSRSRFLWKKGEIEKAGQLLEESRALLEEANDDEALAKVLDSLALFHDHRDASEEAISCYLRSLSKKAQWQDLYGIAITLGNLGRLHLKMHRPRAALDCFKDDLKIAARIGDVHAQVVIQINMGQALTELQRLEEAVRMLESAYALARAHGWIEQQAYALKDLGWALALNDMGEQALQMLDKAQTTVSGEAGGPYVRAQIFLSQGRVLLHLKRLDAAEPAFEKSRRLFASLGARREEALAFHGLAEIAAQRKQWETVAAHVQAGLEHASSSLSSTALRFGSVLETLQNIARDYPLPDHIGPYRVLRWIGGGAFGDVYLALDPERRTPTGEVAIKRLKLVAGDDDRRLCERLLRFERESEALARIRHPNVVRLFDRGEDQGPYLVMECVDKGDLRRLIKQGEPLDLPSALTLGRGILKGLSALHALQLVHRDLKPANILLRDDLEPVIADFGMVRVLNLATITMQSTVVGTIAYMAPEQLQSGRVGAQADIYAFGNILFQMLTSRLPFLGEAPPQLMRRICEEPAPRVTMLRPTLPEPLADCVARCLAKAPEDRYESAEAVLAALEPLGAL